VLGLNPDDYIQITSYKYLPWYGKGEHVIPDNWAHNKDFYNLPLDDFMNAFDYALRNGYSVVVSSDVSEKGFNQKIGYAVLESDKDGVKPVTQDEREKSWDDWSTTDDHGMHAVGVATDEKGDVFYLVKNSWGADADKTGPYAGHIYMSQNFLRGKMHTFMVHKDGIPAELRAKLGIK
jgi:bleomycin hydrolase